MLFLFVGFIDLSSIVVLTQNEQFFSWATIAFSERIAATKNLIQGWNSSNTFSCHMPGKALSEKLLFHSKRGLWQPISPVLWVIKRGKLV